MASINDITTGSSYKGDAALGGYIPSFIDIDTKPVQTLAAYTVMYNKDQYEQRQKDADNKIKELAEISQYDISSARGKDKEIAIQAYADLMKYAKEYAQKGVPQSPQEKIRQEAELKEKTADAISRIKSLNGRGIAYQARLEKINNEKSTAEVKAAKKKQLDDEFDAGDWDTPISAEENFAITLPEKIKPVYTKNTTSIRIGNRDLQQEVTFFNMAKNRDAANASVLDISPASLPPNATPEQKRQFELKQAMGGNLKIWNDAAAAYNEALANTKYKDAEGNIDYNAIAADNPILSGVINLIDRSNQYADEGISDVRKGYYQTKLGQRVSLNSIVSEKDFFKIDKNKPLSATQLAYLDSFSEAAPDTKDEKIVFTGESLKNRELALDEYKAKTERIKANNPASSGGKEAKLIEDPATMMRNHFNRLIPDFKKGMNVTVPYEATDEKTKLALGGLKKGESVQYSPNGSYVILDANKKVVRPGTLEELKSGFINVTKSGISDGSSITEGFQINVEKGFEKIMGTNDINEAFRSMVNGTSPKASTTTTVPAEDLRKKYNY